MWIFVPIQSVIKEFLVTLTGYPMQEGSSLNAAGINYGSLKTAVALERLQELETLSRPNN
jgi:arylsulfatase